MTPLIASTAAKVWQIIGIRGAIAIGLAVALPVHGCMERREGRQEGRESVLAELRAAEAESLKRAAMAAREADKLAEERALAEAEVRAGDIAKIERAEAEGGNSLDALF